MVFQPGKSGNPGGRNKADKVFRDALNLAVKRTEGDVTKLAQIAEALVNKAVSGDVPAINAVADRLDGKVNQAIEVTHDGEVTFRSAAVSALADLIAESARGSADRAGENPLPN